jgi:hypothetical protein
MTPSVQTRHPIHAERNQDLPRGIDFTTDNVNQGEGFASHCPAEKEF